MMVAIRMLAGLRKTCLSIHPAKIMFAGYASYMLIGWALLSLPFSKTVSVSGMDTLFIAVSAVSTTGLVSVDPGTTFSVWGQLIILLLIQAGGIGYMTFSSFFIFSTASELGPLREKISRSAFSLPDDVNVGMFLKQVIVFTLILEAIGAAVLYFAFSDTGSDNPLWSAVFHSVSAFCTAGFSLNANSFEGLRDNTLINITISALSIFGAVGFLVASDIWLKLSGRKTYLGFTSKVIFRTTLFLFGVGTIVVYVIEPALGDLEPWARLQAAFFQVMTASTTVGFNTVSIGTLAPATIMLLYFLMIFGASPAGTGGGLKTTTLTTLIALIRSTLKRRDSVRFFKRDVPPSILTQATASFAFYFLSLGLALFILLQLEDAPLQPLLFEAISAMGTVGLSMGITGELSNLGKLSIIILMFMGRVGILSFGIAVSTHDETREEEADNELVI